MQLVLASKSQGRRKLLLLFHIPFKVMESELDEDKIHATTPFKTIRLRARLKAEEVAKKILTRRYTLDARRFLIISADSDAVLDGRIIGKAATPSEATHILRNFSGRTHDFYTCIFCLKLENGKITKTWETSDHSRVTMRKLTKEDIDLHLKLSDYKRYAGAYALFASPVDLISKVEGSLTNVIGLPLDKLIPILKENHLLSV
ncbi:Maf-like protein [Candidatus Gottesmanbacteria bacterium]|nr:Maf-like protein [Candidatus Gottesmanbacteria bacterium]